MIENVAEAVIWAASFFCECLRGPNRKTVKELLGGQLTCDNLTLRLVHVD